MNPRIPPEPRKRAPATALINAAAVRRRALQLAADTRAHRFTRVSRRFIQDCNARVEALIRQRIHAIPSVGRTIR
jgi:hypothetical protein